jgi:hypothetical protein
VAAASTTRTDLCGLTGGGSPTGSALGDCEGPTVGNSPEASPGDVELPDIGGSVTGGKVVTPVGLVGAVVEVLGWATTTSVAEPLKDFAALALAVAVSCTCSPSAALLPTGTFTCSSSAWPTGTLPTLQVVPDATGHTVKLGVRMYIAQATCTLTVTPELGALALQTHTAKLAACPGLTCEALEKDWTRTQSCGVLAFGGGELLVGVGVGVGVGEPDGLGVGLGEELDGLFVGLADDGRGVGLAWRVGDGLGLVVGAALEVGVEVGLALVAELDGLGELELGELELGTELALGLFVEGVFVAEAPAEGLPDTRLIAASRAAPLGTAEQAAGTMGWLPDCAASAWPSKLDETNAMPVRTPTTAGLIPSCALTCATSLQCSSWPVRPGSSCCPHYALSAWTLLVGENSGITLTSSSSRRGLVSNSGNAVAGDHQVTCALPCGRYAARRCLVAASAARRPDDLLWPGGPGGRSLAPASGRQCLGHGSIPARWLLASCVRPQACRAAR